MKQLCTDYRCPVHDLIFVCSASRTQKLTRPPESTRSRTLAGGRVSNISTLTRGFTTHLNSLSVARRALVAWIHATRLLRLHTFDVHKDSH